MHDRLYPIGVISCFRHNCPFRSSLLSLSCSPTKEESIYQRGTASDFNRFDEQNASKQHPYSLGSAFYRDEIVEMRTKTFTCAAAASLLFAVCVQARDFERNGQLLEARTGHQHQHLRVNGQRYFDFKLYKRDNSFNKTCAGHCPHVGNHPNMHSTCVAECARRLETAEGIAGSGDDFAFARFVNDTHANCTAARRKSDTYRSFAKYAGCLGAMTEAALVHASFRSGALEMRSNAELSADCHNVTFGRDTGGDCSTGTALFKGCFDVFRWQSSRVCVACVSLVSEDQSGWWNLN